MGPEPLPLTVLIPAYRRPDMLERALRSVFGQARPPAEVLVVDDASGDETPERAARLGARVVTHERNLGRGASRNTGLEAASTEWVALLDSDDEWLPAHLEALWEARAAHLLLGTAALRTVDGRHDRVYGWAGPRPLVLRDAADVAVPENKLVSSAVMLRRREALDAGGFRTDMERAEDLDLWIRLLGRGTGLAIPAVTVLYHVHEDQISTDPELMRSAHALVVDAHSSDESRLRTARRRQEGAFEWDVTRAALASGAPTARTLLALAGRVASPGRLLGLGQLLAGRFRSRRLAARYAAGGKPSVAILPGVPIDPRSVEGAVDLSDSSPPGALLHLLRRPTARAMVRGHTGALAVRALGITPVRRPPDDVAIR